MLGILLSGIIGTTVMQPLDYGFNYSSVEQVSTQEGQPFLEGKGTWYDYKLNGSRYSKSHDTCALRLDQRYGHYKVCLKDTDQCVVCRHNDRGPQEYTNKVIDLSSHAFKQLAPLSRGVIEVQIYKLD